MAVIKVSTTSKKMTLPLALLKAKPGDVLQLANGIYKDDLDLTDVTIRATNPLQVQLVGAVKVEGNCSILGVVMRHKSEPNVRLEPGTALTLADCELSNSVGKAPCLSVSKGQSLTLINCKISSSASHGLLIDGGNADLSGCDVGACKKAAIHCQGLGANLIISDCRFNEANSSGGLSIENSASATIRDCVFADKIGTVESSNSPAVLVAKSASFTAKACKFLDSNGHGLSVKDGGEATISDCDFTGCHQHALVAENQDSLIVAERCTFKDTLLNALRVEQRAEIVVRDCDLSRCGEGLALAVGLTGGKLTLAGSRLHNAPLAINLSQGGQADLSDCDLWACGSTAIEVCDPRSYVNMLGSKVRDTLGSGVNIKNNARGTITDCDLTNCGEKCPPIIVAGSAQVSITQCKIHNTESYGLWVMKGSQAIVVESEFWGCGMACMAVEDPFSTLEVTRSHVHETSQIGVYVHSSGKAIIKESELTKCGDTYPVIMVISGGHARAHLCKIHDSSSFGFLVKEAGHAEVYECEFWACGQAAIGALDAQSILNVSRTVIRDTLSNGIYVQTAARATIKDCDISKTGANFPTVLVGGASYASVSHCKIHDAQSHGIWLREGAQLEVFETEIWACRDAAIDVTDAKTYLKLQRSKVRDTNQTGIFVHSGGRLTMNDCDLSKCGETYPLLTLNNNSHATLTNSKLHDVLSHAVWVKEGSRAEVIESEIWGCKIAAFGIQDEHSMLELHRSTIRDTPSNGVWVHKKARAILTNCDLYKCGDKYPPVISESGGLVTVNHCKIHDTPSSGVFVREGGLAEISESEFWGCDQSALSADGVTSSVRAMNCKIRDTHNFGVSATSGARLNISDSDLSKIGPTFPAMHLNGSFSVISRCKMHDLQSNGIWAKDGSQAEVVDCEFWDCREVPIEVIDAKTMLKIHGCRFKSRKAIRCGKDAAIKVEDCRFDGSLNQEEAIVSEAGSLLEATRNSYKTADAVKQGPPERTHKPASQRDKDARDKEKDREKEREAENAAGSGKPIPETALLLSGLDKLVGLQPVKNKLAEIIDVTRYRLFLERDKKSDTNPLKLHMAFLGNSGTGKTTVARLMAKIYQEMGLLTKGHTVEVSRVDLVSGYIGQTAKQTLEHIEKARGGVLFVDEAHSIYDPKDDRDFGKEAITTLITAMTKPNCDFVLILAGYTAPMNNFLDWSTSLKSRLQNQLIEFPDYDPESLIEMFRRRCLQESMILAADGDRKLIEVIHEKHRKRDSTFMNAREIEILYSRTFASLSKRMTPLRKEQATDESKPIDPILRTFTSEDIPDDRMDPVDDIERLLAKLNSLVGLTEVKREITEFVNVVRVNKLREKRGAKPNSVSLHMIFCGNPGTGKTMVARLLGEIFKGLGLLNRGHVVEVSAKDLEARFVGQTAPKTAAKIKEALDGVLFIDEAYELTPDDRVRNFGGEVLSTLLLEMEDKRERLSVIIAGYTKKMRELIKANEGLESRFTRELVFPDYNAQELKQIFLMFCKDASLIVAPAADSSLDHAMSMFDGYRTDTFGNGRAARNFLEEVVKKQAARVIAASEASDPMEIQTSDIEQALEKVMGQMNAGQAKQLGFHTSS